MINQTRLFMYAIDNVKASILLAFLIIFPVVINFISGE